MRYARAPSDAKKRQKHGGLFKNSVRRKSGFVTIWEGFGFHFDRFLGTLGDILVVWKGSGTTVEFQWISGPTQGPPKSNVGQGLRVNYLVSGAQ